MNIKIKILDSVKFYVIEMVSGVENHYYVNYGWNYRGTESKYQVECVSQPCNGCTVSWSVQISGTGQTAIGTTVGRYLRCTLLLLRLSTKNRLLNGGRYYVPWRFVVDSLKCMASSK